jgi:hypothetical protein
MEWITRGFYSLGAGGVLLVAALLVGVIGGRRGPSQLQSK